MSHAQRQQAFRQRQKNKGLVDIRTEIPSKLRDRLREEAKANGRTIKQEIELALENHISKDLEQTMV